MNISELLQSKENIIVLYAPKTDIRQARIALVQKTLDRLQAIQRQSALVNKMLASEERLAKYADSRRLGPILRKHEARSIERGADAADLAAAREIVARVMAKGGRDATYELIAAINKLGDEVQAEDAKLDRLEFRSDARFAVEAPKGMLQ